MCGQRLHGRTNSTSGASTATFAAIEHSVTSTTLRGRLFFTQLIIAAVEPVKSAPSMTSGGHSGCAMIFRPGIGVAHGRDVLGREALVHFAVALPGDDLDLGLGLHVLGQVLVGDQQHARRAEALDDLHRVRRGAADVALGLHVGRRVDVGDDRHAGIGLAQHAHVLARDRGGQRAAGAQVGDQHRLVGRKQLRGLGHEVHAGLHDDVGLRARRFLGELQAVAAEIADAVEDLRRHVVVRQDDGVALLLELVDRLDQRRVVPATPSA